jgi:hypothetical protein
LDSRRITTIARKLAINLGRRFRTFITKGVVITVNDDRIAPVDPLYLNPLAKFNGAVRFGRPIEYEVENLLSNGSKKIGNVRVTFSELPVSEWHKLSNEEKRRRGITKGAGVSVVRAGREVDYGWFFLGGKPRENYDDWWRCEVEFGPELDEAFGITHTKQQIRPKAYLSEILSPDIETTARALNSRARQAHLAAKMADRFTDSEKLAGKLERLLKPPPSRIRARDKLIIDELRARNLIPCQIKQSRATSLTYKIVESATRDTSFYNHARQRGQLILVLNPDHPFYRHIYKRLIDSDLPRDRQLRTQLELLLLSAARSEVGESNIRVIAQLERQRRLWSNTLATFLNGYT